MTDTPILALKTFKGVCVFWGFRVILKLIVSFLAVDKVTDLDIKFLRVSSVQTSFQLPFVRFYAFFVK